VRLADAGGAQAADERQELRIALVMNGGVSLAVWMGGVTLELDRVRRTAHGAYAQLLDLTETDARIDVIAGASAGGINGAVLALAIARGTTVEDIRQLWMTNGDIDRLLRDPMQRDAPSVLKGDEQLLRRIHEAMAAIGQNDAPAKPNEPRAPLHLSITGTILQGELTTYPDRFGAMIPDVTHRALFRFRRPGVPQKGDPWPDDFAPAGDRTEDLPAARLALAARSSASFPGAFEPSFVPVGSTPDELHPDMAGIVDFSSERWVIDGGVLVNTPIRQALDAIKTLPAERPVRRVLGYVVPDPAAPNPLPHGIPSAAEVVLDAVSRLPRVQSVGRELAEIEENNHSVRQRREVRANALSELDSETLQVVAHLLLAPYVLTRRASAADDIVRALVAATGSSSFPTAEQVAELSSELRTLTEAPWLPPVGQPESFADVPVEPWKWGFAPVENAANVALQALQRVVRWMSAGDGRREVHALRERMHEALRALREIERDSAKYWRSAAERVFQQGETVKELATGWATFQEQLGPLALKIAGVVTDVSSEIKRSNAAGDEMDRVRGMLDSLDGGSPSETLRRLLALDVVQRSSGADLAGIEQEVELVLMSADAANVFECPARAEGKLAGLQVGHFGAFYKSSWRANDWMWGRLDGADRLVRTLLDPRRIQNRLRIEGVDAITGMVREIACQSSASEVAAWLAAQWAEKQVELAVRSELEALAEAPDDPPLTALAASYTAICRRVQVEIVVEEIPAVALAVAADRAAGAACDSLGSQWERRLPAEKPLTVERAVTAFKECPVGKETIAEEVGSDRFTKVSTKGVAVVGSVLGGALSRVTVLKPALALIRGLLLTLYLLGRGITESSKTGTFLVALTLALGGALVAVYALGTHVPGLLLMLGSVILIAGVLLAVLRKTWAQIALAATIFCGSTAAYYGIRQWEGRPRWVDPLAAVLAVVLMACAATALGWSGKKGTSKSGQS
jgi:patatin-related protein